MPRNPLLVSNSNKVSIVNAELKLIAKLPNVFPADAKIPIDGELMTIPQIVTVLQDSMTAIGDVRELQAELHSAVVDSDTRLAAARTVAHDLQSYAILVLGRDTAQLASLGFAAPKKPVKTPQVLLLAAAKSAATRKARGTKGKKQRKAIRGVVPARATEVKKG
jgi:hypothetical protein